MPRGSDCKDSTGAYLQPFIITESTNTNFISVARYADFCNAIFQRQHLLNLGYADTKLVWYDKMWTVSIADFQTKEEVEQFKEEQKGNFKVLFPFNNY